MAQRQSAQVTMPATDVRRKFGDLIRRVFSGHEHFIVEKDGLPVAAIISISEYQDLIAERERRQERLRQFEESAQLIGQSAEEQGLTPEGVEAQVEAIRQQLHQQRHGKS